MNFSFGIITDGNNDTYLNRVIDSIEALNIPTYETIIVGNSKIDRDKTTVISFDETVKKAWITKKKNLITQYAKYENIVYSHDYIIYDSDWYDGYLKYGDNYKICMNKIINFDGKRYRDWCICMWNDPRTSHINGFADPMISEIVGSSMKCNLPYDETRFTKYMYFSGAYWVAKKKIMEEFPLDENLSWGEGEDVIWSIQVRDTYKFSMNKYSSVKLLKQKDTIYEYADDDVIRNLEKNFLIQN